MAVPNPPLVVTVVLSHATVARCARSTFFSLLLLFDAEADIELGDFGILFLLFNEGLNLSPEKIRDLGSFFKVNMDQTPPASRAGWGRGRRTTTSSAK